MRTSLAGLTGPTAVDLVATVATDDATTSPLSGARAAVIVVDVVERATPLERDVGRAVLGDTLLLRADGGDLALVARRARFVFAGGDERSQPLDRVPPDLAFLLGRAAGSGPLAWREHVLVRGGRVRVRAIVEASGAGGFVARGDLAPVVVTTPF